MVIVTRTINSNAFIKGAANTTSKDRIAIRPYSDIYNLGETAILSRVTETYDNITGTATRTYEEDKQIKIIFYQSSKGHNKAFSDPADNIKKNDKLSIFGNKYLVETAHPHAWGDQIICVGHILVPL